MPALQGGMLRDILIAGKGGGHLQSHGGDDILVGGCTDYDSDLLALESIMAEWDLTGPADPGFAARVSALSGMLNASTVHDDGVSDQL